MSITQQFADAYFVRSANRMDWAHIFLTEGRGNASDGAPYRWGTISFTSTFGNRGHQFGAIGDTAFPLWLAGCDWQYLAGKFWGTEATVFDFDKTVAELRQRLAKKTHAGTVAPSDARSCRHEIAALEHAHNEGAFCGQLMYDCPHVMRHLGVYDESPIMKRNNPQCDGFRDEIWQPFCVWIRDQARSVA